MEMGAEKRVSIWNWLGSIILSLIPGVNLLFFIAAAIFAKNPSKKTYALAGLLLTLVVLIIAVIVVCIWGSSLVSWAQNLLAEAKAAV